MTGVRERRRMREGIKEIVPQMTGVKEKRRRRNKRDSQV